jgi:S1-C subfamily serine protease
MQPVWTSDLRSALIASWASTFFKSVRHAIWRSTMLFRRFCSSTKVGHHAMRISQLIEMVRSGVIHIEFHLGSNRVASGSGFMTRGLLVTNHHVFLGPPDSTVVLAWQPTQDPTSRVEIRMDYGKFAASLVTGSDRNNFDFAVLRIPELQRQGLYQFDLASPYSKRIGEQVVVLGFPFEHRNLVCHLGTISSFYLSGPASIIQLDASVNQSNSGGPLLDGESGQVIGVVTRKGTGLSRLFDELLSVFDRNVQVLSAAKGTMSMSGIDPVAAIIAGQHQMKALASEIQRSANVGIGYAFSADHVLADAVFSSDPAS